MFHGGDDDECNTQGSLDGHVVAAVCDHFRSDLRVVPGVLQADELAVARRGRQMFARWREDDLRRKTQTFDYANPGWCRACGAQDLHFLGWIRWGAE